MARAEALAPRLLLALGTLALAVHGIAVRTLDDWHVFYLAGQRALTGEALYRAAEIPMVFKYAPVTAYAFAPFTAFSERAGGALWLLTTAALLYRALVLAHRLFTPAAPAWVLVAVFGLAVGFAKQVIHYGQCDVLLVWLVLESLAVAAARPGLSGALLGAACLFKPPLALLVLLALAARQWQRVGAVALTGAAGALLPALTFGLSGALAQLDAWRAMLAQTTGPMVCTSNNQGVFGLACIFTTPEAGFAFTALALGFGALVVGAVGALLVLVRRCDAARARTLTTAFAIYLVALLSPLSWRANLVALVPLLFLLVEGARQLERWPARLAVVLAPGTSALLALVAFEVLSADGYYRLMWLRSFGVLGIVTAVTAAAVTLRHARANEARAP